MNIYIDDVIVDLLLKKTQIKHSPFEILTNEFGSYYAITNEINGQSAQIIRIFDVSDWTILNIIYIQFNWNATLFSSNILFHALFNEIEIVDTFYSSNNITNLK